MALDKKVIDLQAANKLNISITSITPNQAWKRQIRGAYSFLYPHIMGDFLHLEDFEEWMEKVYNKHKHKSRGKGADTTEPLTPLSILSNSKARSYLENSKILGYIRTGISTIQRLIQDLSA